MVKPKLTETTNDRLARKQRGNGAVEQLHITEAHEPLGTGEMPPFQAFQMPPMLSVAQPVVTAAPPAVAIETVPLKVALIGTAPSSRMMAPFNDKSWKIWGCSPGNQNVLPRVDAWFEIHGNLMWPEHKHYGEPYIEWMKKLTVPVYMQDQSLIPHARVFPKAELVQEFGNDFFSSSFTWMMAFALKCGAKEIALYGIDMASRDEYILQRPGFYFFRYVARLYGCNVSAPKESDIMQSPGLYGYSDVTPMGRKIHAREKEIKDRVAAMKQQRDSLTTNITYLEGALEDLDYMKAIWLGAQDNSTAVMPDVRNYLNALNGKPSG